jgi:ABC-type transport system involved in cytochrome bd biosynthesis fused ATPase/permease subunit
MYIIAIAWIYVVLMMAITEPTLTASIMTFLFYCVLPLALFFYLIRAPKRKQRRQEEEKLTSSAISPDHQSSKKTNPSPLKKYVNPSK